MRLNRLYRRLKVALRHRDIAALTELVRSHPEAHAGCDQRAAPVAMIAMAGLDLLEAAFAAGLSPDAGSSTSETFLQNAAANGDLPTVALCIKYGADVNALEHDHEDDLRNTALDCCARHPAMIDPMESVRPPVFVLEGRDVSLYPSVADAIRDLEGVDVAEGVYKVFDSAGRRIVLRAAGVRRGRFVVNVGTVHVDRIEDSPAGVAELRDALIEYMTAIGRTGLDATDLTTLVDAVRHSLGK